MLDRETKRRLADRLEGWEIVDFLQLSAEDIIDTFEEEIIQHLEDVLEFAGLRDEDDEEESDRN